MAKCANTTLSKYVEGLPGESGVTHDNDSRESTNYFVFTFVRDPYTRFLSGYNQLVTNPIADPQIAEINSSLSINEYIDVLSSHINEDPHCTMQSYMYLPQIIDYCGRFENLDADMTFIYNRFGLPREPLSRRNTTSRRTSFVGREAMTLDVKNKVYSLYKEDFLMFGYKR